jgi:pantoate--beta-alanine ligase
VEFGKRQSYCNRGPVSATLRQAGISARLPQPNFAHLERIAYDSLAARGWQPEYVAIRRRTDLGSPSVDELLIVLGAARLGNTRLIVNIEA